MRRLVVCALLFLVTAGGGRAAAQETGDAKALVAQLASQDAAARTAAADALVKAGAASVPALVEGLADTARRPAIVGVLERLGPAAKDAVPQLTAFAKGPGTAWRPGSVRALAAIGADAAPATAALGGIVGQPRAKDRADALRALETILVDVARRLPRTPAPPKVRSAVDAGCGWLARHQGEDGAWSSSAFDAHCKGGHKCAGTGESPYDIGVTGLAVLALVGAGEDDDPARAKARDAGIAHLVASQQADGILGPKTSMHFMYNHGCGALALAEAYRRTKREDLRAPVEKAVQAILAAQNRKVGGGWRYSAAPDGDSDTSITVWMVKVLRSATDAGIVVDPAALQSAVAWIDSVTDPATGRTGYQQKGGPPARTTSMQLAFPQNQSESLTACALIVRIAGGAARSDPLVRKGLTLLGLHRPAWDLPRGTVDLYYWLQGSHAVQLAGGPDYTAWRQALVSALLPPIREGPTRRAPTARGRPPTRGRRRAAGSTRRPRRSSPSRPAPRTPRRVRRCPPSTSRRSRPSRRRRTTTTPHSARRPSACSRPSATHSGRRRRAKRPKRAPGSRDSCPGSALPAARAPGRASRHRPTGRRVRARGMRFPPGPPPARRPMERRRRSSFRETRLGRSAIRPGPPMRPGRVGERSVRRRGVAEPAPEPLRTVRRARDADGCVPAHAGGSVGGVGVDVRAGRSGSPAPPPLSPRSPMPITEHVERRDLRCVSAPPDRSARLPAVSVAQWMDLAGRRTDGVPLRRVLDLGCGTGRFAPSLAESLRAAVVAVDRSELILDFAREENAHPRVTYLRAEGVRLPLRDASCGAAWLSMVVHCFADLRVVADELHRVVAPGGVVLVRNLFRERLGELLLYAFFPSALPSDEARLPTAAEVRGAFEESGLVCAGMIPVVQVVDPDIGAHAERMRIRAAPCFDAVPDEEYEIGLLAMEAVAAADALPGPVTETLDLLTFVRA
jgi:SAM-dependent methyltransferase